MYSIILRSIHGTSVLLCIYILSIVSYLLCITLPFIYGLYLISTLLLSTALTLLFSLHYFSLHKKENNLI